MVDLKSLLTDKDGRNIYFVENGLLRQYSRGASVLRMTFATGHYGYLFRLSISNPRRMPMDPVVHFEMPLSGDSPAI